MFLTKRGLATAAFALVRAQPVVAPASVPLAVAPLVSATAASATRNRRRRMPAPYPRQPPSPVVPSPVVPSPGSVVVPSLGVLASGDGAAAFGPGVLALA